MKINTHHIKKLAQGLFLGMLLFTGSVSFAQTQPQQYTVLAPLPGTTNDGGNCTGTNCQSDLSHYLPGLFNLLIGVGAVAAFVVITIYGLELMLSDSLITKTSAKAMVENALWGLGLVIFAWVILNTINPALVTGKLQITTPTVTTPPTATVVNPNAGQNINVAGVPMSLAQLAADTAVRQSLAQQHVNAYAGPCTNGQTTGCVDLNGLTSQTQADLVSLKNSCGSSCNVLITGGTEAGHDVTGSHPYGTGVDLSADPGLTTYLTQTLGAQAIVGKTTTVTINGQTAHVLYEAAGTQLSPGGSVSSGVHWHISF